MSEPSRADSPFDAFEEVVREPRLSDKVVERMRETIRTRGLAPGTPLPSERELSEQFGVSRTVIREAVRALAAKGIVEVRSGSGLRVAAIGEETVSESLSWFIRGARLDFMQVHEVRSTVETTMAGLAAQRRTDEQLESLREVQARFEKAVGKVDSDLAARIDLEFHDGIARATQNPLFAAILSSIADALLEIRRENLASGTGPKTLSGHAEILDRIAAGDAKGASRAMREHLEHVAEVWETSHTQND